MAEDMSQARRLAATLAADMAAYSRLIGVDEDGTSTGCGRSAPTPGRTRVLVVGKIALQHTPGCTRVFSEC
jgi:hypothetical protein